MSKAKKREVLNTLAMTKRDIETLTREMGVEIDKINEALRSPLEGSWANLAMAVYDIQSANRRLESILIRLSRV